MFIDTFLRFILQMGRMNLATWIIAFWSALAGGQAQTPVRIVAANLSSGNYQDYQAPGTRILQALDPDIVLIQEFNVPGANNTAAVNTWVASTFGSGYFWYREPGNQSIPNGIISRYPLLETGEWHDTQVPDRDFVWARIDMPGSADLWAISVHLKTSSSSTQNAQVQLVLNAMQAKGIPTTDYVVIGGDFNTSSRTAAPMTTLASSAWDFVTAAPYPVGEDGDPDTNAGRSSPYDWVVPNAALNNLKSSTIYGPSINLAAPSKTYPNGFVFDTRIFNQSSLNEYFSPAQVGDSGVSGMQHMAVVRTFLFPASGPPPADGTVATLAFTDKAPAQIHAGGEAAMLGVTISVNASEWDGASIALQRSGTVADAQVVAKVYEDVDANGLLSGADKLLGSGTFSGGLATVGLGTPAPRATSSQPIHLLVAATVLAGTTDGSSLEFIAQGNGITSAVSGGADPNPVFPAVSSSLSMVTNNPPPPPPPVSAAVVVNKWLNASTSAGDTVELLVVQNDLDMRGMILKDFSSSMANDNGGRYQFANHALWSSVRAGTLIVLRNDLSVADTSAVGTDFALDIGLNNTTYFAKLGSNTFDIAATEMVMIKAAGSGETGTAGSLHALAGGTPGTQYTGAPDPKLNGAPGASNSEYFIVTSTGPSGDSRLANYGDGGGTAVAVASGVSFGQPNNTANANFIAILRGTTAISAVNVGPGQFDAQWLPLTAAAGYQLDVSRGPDFDSYVAGYAGLEVGIASSATVDGLSDGTYYYRVRAVDADGTLGRASNTMAVTVTTDSAIENWSTY